MSKTRYTFPHLGGELQLFMQHYDLQEAVFCSDGFLTEFPHYYHDNNKTNAVCRFCGKNQNEVTFNKKAHLLSKLLGNYHLYSNSECDNCNTLFRKYEENLANYLGIDRTIQGLDLSSRTPQFQSWDRAVTAKKNDFFGNEAIEIAGLNGELQFNALTGEGSFQYVKKPFVPLMVFKIFLKFAISCLGDNDLACYPYLTKALISDQYDNYLRLAEHFYHATIPKLITEKPYVLIFKKRNINANFPTHVVSIYYDDKVFQFALPLHRYDNYKGYYGQVLSKGLGSGNLIFCPPLLNEVPDDTVAGIILIRNMFSTKEQTEKVTHRYQLSKDEIDNMVCLNINTLKKSDKPIPDRIVKMILTRSGSSIPITE